MAPQFSVFPADLPAASFSPDYPSSKCLSAKSTFPKYKSDPVKICPPLKSFRGSVLPPLKNHDMVPEPLREAAPPSQPHFTPYLTPFLPSWNRGPLPGSPCSDIPAHSYQPFFVSRSCPFTPRSCARTYPHQPRCTCEGRLWPLWFHGGNSG